MSKIEINNDECTVCFACINDCPNNYLFLEDNTIKTQENGCIE